MPSNFRIPQAKIDRAYDALMRRVSQRMWSQVPDNAYVLWHNLPVMNGVFGFERKVAKWKSLGAHLKTCAVMARARVIVACGAWTSATSWPVRTASTRPWSGRCRAGESRKHSPSSSATSWRTPKR